MTRRTKQKRLYVWAVIKRLDNGRWYIVAHCWSPEQAEDVRAYHKRNVRIVRVPVPTPMGKR